MPAKTVRSSETTLGDVTLIHLGGATTSVVLSSESSQIPTICYWGSALSDTEIASLPAATDRPRAKASLNRETPIGIVTEQGSGFAGLPGIVGSRFDGSDFAPRFMVTSHRLLSELGSGSGSSRTVLPGAGVRWELADQIAELQLDLRVFLVEESELVLIQAELINKGSTPYRLDKLAISVPIQARATELLRLGGRWTDEFRTSRQPWSLGTHSHHNWRGRTSHDKVPALFAGTSGFTETDGDVWGVHLGWSGNAETSADRLSDGRRYLHLAESLFDGEVVLEPDQSYETPQVHGVYSSQGIGNASIGFHRFLRTRSRHPKPDRPRPVMLNTWEAVYFDHDVATLKELATAAASVGVERFVLDDGWFRGRNDDTSALGDWFVDDQKYPDGLNPLIDHVISLGMEFGLWFEPEMVNPDSDLFRQHPEWAMMDHRYEQRLGRNQLLLDLTNPEAWQFVLERLDVMLSDHPIGYVKWDMNRDLLQPTVGAGARTHQQTLAVYRMLDELHQRHPAVEIESCSSGGARADFEILARTERIWTSDCNDALDRQSIQRGFSLLFPPELMGSHIGPPTSHTTGRTHDLSFRAASAFFGHLGIEWNLLEADEQDRASLAQFVSLHKQHRQLLHSGQFRRLDSADPARAAMAVVADDKSEAIVLYTTVATPREAVPHPLVVPGLLSESGYEAALMPLPGRPLEFGETRPSWLEQDNRGQRFSGRLLANAGLQLPIMHPESALLLHLVVVD